MELIKAKDISQAMSLMEDHDEEADKKDNDCQCLDCHISSPPLQKSS